MLLKITPRVSPLPTQTNNWTTQLSVGNVLEEMNQFSPRNAETKIYVTISATTNHSNSLSYSKSQYWKFNTNQNQTTILWRMHHKAPPSAQPQINHWHYPKMDKGNWIMRLDAETHLGCIQNIQDLLQDRWARGFVLLLTTAMRRGGVRGQLTQIYLVVGHLQNFNVSQFGIIEITLLL